MSELIGYARCSTAGQDLTAQRGVLRDPGVGEPRMYLDHGLTGRHRERPGPQLALAAVREGDTLVVPKLDRLARSVPDARAIADELEQRGCGCSSAPRCTTIGTRWGVCSSTCSRRPRKWSSWTATADSFRRVRAGLHLLDKQGRTSLHRVFTCHACRCGLRSRDLSAVRSSTRRPSASRSGEQGTGLSESLELPKAPC
jgi:hypothetical protein